MPIDRAPATPVRDTALKADYYLIAMNDGPRERSSPASEEPLTRHRPMASSGLDQVAEPPTPNPSYPPAEFTPAEQPTLSSPSSDLHPTPLMDVEARVQTLEDHLDATERELAEVYGAVEHLVKRQEAIDRTLQQQRHGRYLMWGTLIAILAMLWLTLRSRLGILGPR